jgi:hypothetical protein
MFSRHARFAITVAIVVTLPLLLYWATWNTDLGLIGLFFYNLYYAPLSWIGLPFFDSAVEIGVVARWPGFVLAAVIYSALLYGARRWLSRARYSGAEQSEEEGK